MSQLDEKQFKILIAAEDAQFKNSLASSLRVQNFIVELDSSGFHLLHVLEKNNGLSLLVIYEDLGDMSSEELISLIRLKKNKNELPILYITKSEATKDQICDMLAIGANEYIVRGPNFTPVIEKMKIYFSNAKNS